MSDKFDNSKLDPRAFIATRGPLWVVNSDNPRAPLLKGYLLIPTRLYDFCYQKCQFEHFAGEKCIKLNIAYWERIRDKNNPEGVGPEYSGRLFINTPSIISEDRKYYEEIRRTRQFSLVRN